MIASAMRASCTLPRCNRHRRRGIAADLAGAVTPDRRQALRARRAPGPHAPPRSAGRRRARCSPRHLPPKRERRWPGSRAAGLPGATDRSRRSPRSAAARSFAGSPAPPRLAPRPRPPARRRCECHTHVVGLERACRHKGRQRRGGQFLRGGGEHLDEGGPCCRVAGRPYLVFRHRPSFLNTGTLPTTRSASYRIMRWGRSGQAALVLSMNSWMGGSAS